LGAKPSTIQTYLSAFATAGTSTINVDSASGWAVGDELAISPSFADIKQYEVVTISAIVDTTITLAAPLKFSHFGAGSSSIIKSDFGSLDTRARVGHLTRNVKIVSGT